MIKNKYFYLDYFSQSFKQIVGKDDFNFQSLHIIGTNAFNKDRTVYCDRCKKMEKITFAPVVSLTDYKATEHCPGTEINKVQVECGNLIEGYFFEAPQPFNETANSKDTRKNIINTYNKIETPYKITKNEFADFKRSIIETKKAQIAKRFLRNVNGLSKNFFFIKFSTNYDEATFTLECFIIDFDQFYFFPASSDFSNAVKFFQNTFSLNNGDYKLNIPANLSIPEEILENAVENYKELIDSWAGKKLTYSSCDKGINLLESLTKYPYCPNIYRIETHGLVKKYKNLCDRKNPECYKELCKKIKIKDYRHLRKVFCQNPKTLIFYKMLMVCKFKNTDIINALLDSNYVDFYTAEENYENFIFFCKKARKYCGEKQLLNRLTKVDSDLYILKDSLSMFYLCYKHIKWEVKKSIYKNGFTAYNHDVLATISNSLKTPNRKFKYNENQLKLKDKINGYEFNLPANTKQIIEIGVKMHNCVGSYDEAIRENMCTVVYAKKNNEYKLCIEIRENEIHQQRADYNRNPEGEEAAVMELYQQRHNLLFTENKF